MKIVIFGLTISSSWGNGHATVWRSLCRQLVRRGHDVVFFEHDVPYYAAHRDLWTMDGVTLRFYQSWNDIVEIAARELREADVGIVTSYCPDAIAASEFVWSSQTTRVFFDQHLPPAEHPSFFCSSRLTLNVTRGAMREMGWCPSGRLFEAAACGTPIVSDWWNGLDDFFAPHSEILIASSADDVLAALELSDAQLNRTAHTARERVLAEHTGAQRARQFEEIIERVHRLEMAAA